MNHIALSAPAQAEVDAVVAYLADRGIPALFETPRHRPEFAHGPDQCAMCDVRCLTFDV